MGNKRQPSNKRRKDLRNKRRKISPSLGGSERFEKLEDRNLLAVDFVPLPLGGTSVNRVDQALGLSAPATQPAIALDASDPGILAVANESELVLSNNAGNSFNAAGNFQSLLGGSATAGGSSELVYTADGELKWSAIRIADDGTQSVGVTFTQSSPQTFGVTAVPSSAGAIVARPMVVADTNDANDSAFAGRLYVSFTDETTNRVLLSRSEDGGLTWLAPTAVSEPSETVAGNLPPVTPAGVAVGPNGDVYVAYHYQSGSTAIEGADDRSNSDGITGQIFVRRSTDGGLSFVSKSNAFMPAEADVSLNVQTVSGAIPRARFSNQGSRQPSILVDPVREGHVYVIAADDPDDVHGSGDEGDIVFARSTDFGQTWARRTIETGVGFQAMPQAEIDPFGNIVVAWYDSQLGQLQGGEDYRLHVFATYSVDGGSEWATPIQVTDTTNPTDPVTPNTAVIYPGADLDNDSRMEDDGDETHSLGDYFDVEVFGGTAYVVWNGNIRTIGLPSAHQVFFDVFPIFGTLHVTGLDTDDSFFVRAMPDNSEYIEVFVNGQREYAGLLESLTGGIQFDGLAGNDTLVVDYETGSADPVPPGGIFFQGNIPEGGQDVGDTLDILSGGRSIAFQNEPSDLDAGLFVIGDSASVSFDSVERTQIDSTDYLRPDAFEANDSFLTASVLGSDPAVTLRDLTIHSVGQGQSNDDFYQVTAHQTGMLIVHAAYDATAGDLQVAVLDSRGFEVDATTADGRIVVPVVAQEVYTVRINGVDGATHAYSLELENFAAPAPLTILLDAADDTGRSADDGVTAEVNPQFTIQADLSALDTQGVALLTKEQAEAGDQAGAAVFVQILDGNSGEVVASGYASPLSGGLYSFSSAELPDGDLVVTSSVHIFDVRRMLPAGGEAPIADPVVGPSFSSPAIFLHVDNESPAITSPELLPSSDSGMSREDNVTNIMQPAFAGTTEPSALVRILANGNLVGETVAGTDGRWEVTIEPLTDGIYDIASQAQDIAGNFGESDIVNRIEIDKTPPNTPFLDLASTSDTGLSSTDNVTGDRTPTFTMTTTDANNADHLNRFNFKYRLYARSQEGAEELVYDSSADTSIGEDNIRDGFTDLGILTTTLDELPEGVHNFKLEVEDRAGNISPDFLLPVVIGVPANSLNAVAIDLLSVSDTGMSDTDDVTNKDRPAFTGVATVGTEVRLTSVTDVGEEVIGRGVVSGDASNGVIGDGLGIWEATSNPLDDGVYNVLAEVEDDFGNTVRTETLRFEVDTIAPNTPQLDLIPSDDSGLSNQDNVTSQLLPSFNMATVDSNKESHINAFNFKYRLYVRLDSGVERKVYDSSEDGTFPASAIQDGFISLENLRREIDLGVPDGVHSFKLEVEDRAGNISEDVVLDVTIDTVLAAPDEVVSIDLAPGSDSGMSGRDRVTNINQPAFTGVAEVGATVSIFANGQLFGTQIVGSDETDFVPGDGLGAWEVTVQSLDGGQYDVLAHVEDLAGNFLRSEAIRVEIDTTPPNIPALDLLDDTGHSDHDNITELISPQFNLTTTDPKLADGSERASEFNLKYRIYARQQGAAETLLYNSVVDGDLDAANLVEGFTNLNQIQTTLGPFSDGKHSLALEVEDRAGNISEDFLLEFEVDSTLDGESSINLLAASDTGMLDTDNVTNISTPSFGGVAEIGSAVRLFADGQLVGTGEVQSDFSDGAPGDGLGVWQVAAETLADGSYEFTAEIEDWAGNLETTVGLTVEIDTVAPNTPLLDLLSDSGHSDHDDFTSAASPEFSMTTEDSGTHANEFNLKYRLYLRPDGGEEFLVYDSGGDTSVAGPDGFTDLNQLTSTFGPFPDGTHNFKLEVEDRAGNVSQDYLLDVTIDSTIAGPPTVELQSSSDTGMSSEDLVTSINRPAFSGVGEVGSTVRLFAGENLVGVGEVQSDATDGNPDDGLGLWEITSEPLDDGLYEITAQVEDWAGNVATTSSLTIEVDTIAPNTPQLDLLPDDDTGFSKQDNVTSELLPTFNMATVDSNREIHISPFNFNYRLYVRLDSGVERKVYDSAEDTEFPASAAEDGFTRLENLRRQIDLGVPDGVHNFKLEVEDRAGNISTDTLLNVTIDTVLDTIDPEAPVVAIDLIAGSDTGMSDRDDVTRINTPTFSGVGEVGAMVSIFANGQFVGTGVIGSDETDFIPNDGLGVWEVTVDALDDGLYDVLAHVEDLAGNFLRSEVLQIEIDTTQPNTPYLDLLNDAGHADYDNITDASLLEFNLTTTDPSLPDGADRTSDFNLKYRVYLRPEGGEEQLIYNSVVDNSIDPANILEGFTDLNQLQTTLGPFPDGIHNFKLEVEDRAGNVSEDFLLTVQIDNELEGEPSIDMLTVSDSGMSDSDNITGINQPAFTGVAEVGSTVRLIANDQLVGVAEVQSDDSDGTPGDGLGQWEITSEPLDDGIYDVRADVEDWAGNVESTGVLQIEVDTLQPNTPLLDLTPASDSGLSDADNVTSIVNPTFNMATLDPNQDAHLLPFNYKYRLFIRHDSGVELQLYDSSADEASFTPSSFQDGFTSLENLRRTIELGVPDGVHNFKLEVEDRAGNISEDFLLNVTIDTQLEAPDQTITIDMLGASDTGMGEEDNVTNKDQPTIAGIAEVGSMVTILADGRVVGTAVVGSDETDLSPGDGFGAWQVTVQPLDDGIHDLTAHVEDLAGNFLRSTDLTIEIDTQAPNTPFLDLVSESDTGLLGRDEVTSDNTLTFNMTTTDATAPDGHLFAENYKFRLYVRPEGGSEELVYNSVTDGDLPPEAFRDGLIDLEFLQRTLDELPDGTHNFKLEVEDRAGNISDDFLLNVTIDTSLTAPTIDLIDSSDTGMSNADNVTSKDQPAFAGVGDVGDRVSLFANGVLVGTGVVGSDLTDFVPGDGRGAWEITSEPLADGVYDVIAHVEDLAGSFERTSPVQIEVDTFEPNTPHLDLVTASDTGHSPHDNITSDSTPTFTFTTEDPNAVAHLNEFNLKYRLYLRPEGGEEVLVYNSVTDPTIPAANIQNGFVNLTFLETTLAQLPDGIHNFKLEVEDRAGNISHDVVLDVEIDSTLPDAGNIDLLDASDTGMSNTDNVTNKDEPAFAGVGTAGTLVRLFANNELVGSGEVGSDESDGIIGDGLGIWEITSEPLDDGVYDVNATFEDWAGQISTSASLQIEVDTLQPNTPFLDLLEPDDSGRHDDDGITNAIVLNFSATTEDPNAANHLQLFPGGENFKYRIFVRPESGTETLVYNSVTDASLVGKVDGFVNLNQLNAEIRNLPEGLHNFKLEVEDRAGNISEDFLANILIDRTAFQGTIALHPDSDTGVWGITSTFGDGVTGDSTPTFSGTAEANNIVTLFVDGQMVGTTVVKPFDGDDAFTMGGWEITSAVLLSDGPHTVNATFQDPAGNQTASVDVELTVDTTGPRIDNVTRADLGFTSIFDPKPAGGPDPLIDSIVVHFSDLPNRSATIPYDAVLQQLALEEGNYRLVGDANGDIPIIDAQILSNLNSGPGAATTAVQLFFAESLPDDRFTFTVFDRIADPAGNPLDGDSGANGPFAGNDALNATAPIFPTGDGNHGGDFIARFTIDSRPEIGVWSAGSVYVDTNGNFQFDPTNRDFTNRDITYALGFASDDIFAGNFAGPDGQTDGYDKLAAYGRYGGWVGGTYRWLVDLDNDGVVDIDVEDPADVNGLPVAGNFNGDATDGDEVGLYTGSVWHFDTDGDYLVDLAVPSELKGYPVVGDFDRDGHEDLGTWADDVFTVDLANGVANGWDGSADASFRFGFIGVRERPVAADMDQDGFDDLGLWVPDRGGITPRESGEWYWLVSGGDSLLDRIVPATDAVGGSANQILFRPEPFGQDIFAQFGDEFGIPIVGNFDPPTLRLNVPVRQHTNLANPMDVTNDGAVSPRDVLAAVRYINDSGAASVADLPDDLELYLDTNQDGYFSPSDILAVITYLNQQNVAASEPQDLDVLAADVAAAAFAGVSDDDEDDDERAGLSWLG